MRMIDADALEKEMCSGCEYNKNKYANCDDCAIANAPTIDEEPMIVRCKDCFFEECKAKEFYGENGFCSIGARKRKDKMGGKEE